MLDVSEQCGYTIQQQATLFHSISPLFASKPLLVVANKVSDPLPMQVGCQAWLLLAQQRLDACHCDVSDL